MEEAKERLKEALAEASAARRDAARHRAAASAAEQERHATDAERDRLAAESSRLKGEVRYLTRQLDEASTSLQEQVGWHNTPSDRLLHHLPKMTLSACGCTRNKHCTIAT